LIRADVAKTETARWATLPKDVFEALLSQLPPREDRDPEAPLFGGATADQLRMAIGRACKLAGVPHWTPHDLRRRRVSLGHKQGLSWAEIGEHVGQQNIKVTGLTYARTLDDYTELDRTAVLVGC
jgi:integrase